MKPQAPFWCLKIRVELPFERQIKCLQINKTDATNKTSCREGEAHWVSWHSVCLEWELCTLSAAHCGSAWCTLSTRGSAHACMPCALFTACGWGAVQQPHPTSPGICTQTSSTSSHTPLLLFVLVFREEDGGAQGIVYPVVLQYTCTCMCPQGVGKLLCFFLLGLVFVRQWMWSVSFQVMPRAT